MRTRVMLILYLALVLGLLLAAVPSAGSMASPVAGPPPAGTPQGPVKAPSTCPLDLTGQPAGRQVGTVRMHLDSVSVPHLSVRPVTPTDSGTGWQRIAWEDFEGALTDPPWRSSDFSSMDGGEYLWGQRDCRALSGSTSVWAGGGGTDGGSLNCGDTYANNLLTWLRYGPVDLSQASDAELQFSLWADVEGDAQGPVIIDKISWLASIDGSHTYAGYATSGQTGDWIPEGLDLSNVPLLGDITGEPEVYLGWVFESNESNPINYEGAFVDDVALWVYADPPPTPPPPTSTLPITRHTTLADFAGGRSHDSTVVEAEQGDGALTLAMQVDTLGAWERLPSLLGALFDFAAVTAKGHLFIIGGNAPGGQYQRGVYSAAIQDDGLLGHWANVAELPQALTAHTAAVANGHLFVIGGFNANGFQATVFSAPVNDDGTLDEWKTLPALPEPLAVNASVSAHGYIYVLGGRKSHDPVIVSDNIYRAKVNANGTLSDWETLLTPLPRSSMWHEAVVACDHIYMIAGQDAVINEYSAVYQTEIHPDGSLGVWKEAIALPKTLAAHAAATIRGGILVTGGWSTPDPSGSVQRNVYWAPLGPDCSLGSWVELTPLPYSTYRHALAATGRYVYSLGGVGAASRTFASVLMASLQLGASPVEQGAFNHQFHLGDTYTIGALRWTEEGSGDAQVRLRYRVGDAGTGEYGPWSDYTLTNPITIDALGGFLEYQLQFEDGGGLGERYVTEVSIDIAAPHLVYLPLVVKD
jgi:hypothetical protein